MATSTKELVIFGVGKISEVVSYYARTMAGRSIAAFTVDKAFITQPEFLGAPVVDFESVQQHYDPARYDMFVAVGYHDLNRLRERKFSEALAKGYQLPSILSPELPGNVSTGRNCFVMPPALVHPCVTLKDNVFVWSGAMVGHHSVIEDHAWLTSACHVSGNVRIGKRTFLAVNATIGHSVTIGEDCFLGANALVTKNLEGGKVCIAEGSRPIKLNSEQFLRFSKFSDL